MSRLGVLLKDDPVRGTAPPAACDGITYFLSSLDPDPSGFIGGVQAGYNWQAGAIVIGLEIDLSHSSLDDRDSAIRIDSGPLPFRTSLDTRIEWFSTVCGRVGFLPLRGLMVFATGGLAFGETEQTLKWANLNPFGAGGPIIGPNNGSQLVCPAAGDCLAGSNSEISVGWTGGGGFEFAVSDVVTLKGEYLFVDLGSSTVTARPTPLVNSVPQFPTFGDVFLRANVENQLNVIRAGINVKLN